MFSERNTLLFTIGIITIRNRGCRLFLNHSRENDSKVLRLSYSSAFRRGIISFRGYSQAPLFYVKISLIIIYIQVTKLQNVSPNQILRARSERNLYIHSVVFKQLISKILVKTTDGCVALSSKFIRATNLPTLLTVDILECSHLLFAKSQRMTNTNCIVYICRSTF